MAHYAFLDSNNIVTQVIVGKDEEDLAEGVTDWEVYYGDLLGQTCKRTSYNTVAGVHSEGGSRSERQSPQVHHAKGTFPATPCRGICVDSHP